MSEKTLRLILRGGAVAAFACFFVVDMGLYFPYITAKQLVFNILVEVLAVIWLWLVVVYHEARPRLTPIIWALVAWLAVLAAAAVGGVNFTWSFWGDAERMLGWVSLAHYFVFFLIIVTVFTDKKSWRYLIDCSLVAAVLLVIYALVTYQGARGLGNVNLTSNISTLGNATYVAGVLLINFWLAFWSLIESRGQKWRRLAYAAALILILIGFFFADVSGSQAALAIGLAVAAVIFGAGNKNSKVKIWTWSGLAVFVLVIGLLFAWRWQPLFDNTRVGKIFRDFSLANGTLNTRFYAWRYGWQGFLARPVLGWGYGNYNVVFDRFFTADFYRWSPHEEYFDRAHNMVVEMLATAGVFGLIAYLAIFVVLLYCLFAGYKKGKLNLFSLAVAVAAVTSYFIHNLAAFDSLANLICWMVLAALINFWVNGSAKEGLNAVGETSVANKLSLALRPALIVLTALAMLTFVYNYNIESWRMLKRTVVGAAALYGGEGENFLAALKGFENNLPLDRHSRLFFASNIVEHATVISGFSASTRAAVWQLAPGLLKENLADNPRDSFINLRQAQLLNMAAIATKNDDLAKQSFAAAQLAIASGGEHFPPRIVLANIYLTAGQPAAAEAEYQKMLQLAPFYEQTYCYLARNELRYPKEIEQTNVWNNLDKCLDKGALKILGSGAYLRPALERYRTAGDQVRLNKLRPLVDEAK